MSPYWVGEALPCVEWWRVLLGQGSRDVECVTLNGCKGHLLATLIWTEPFATVCWLFCFLGDSDGTLSLVQQTTSDIIANHRPRGATRSASSWQLEVAAEGSWALGIAHVSGCVRLS